MSLIAGCHRNDDSVKAAGTGTGILLEAYHVSQSNNYNLLNILFWFQ